MVDRGEFAKTTKLISPFFPMDEDEPVCTSSLSESWYLIRKQFSS